MQHLWDNTLYSIRHKLDTHQYNSWFKPIVCEAVTDAEIVLKVPDRFFGEWIQKNYLDLLRAALRQQTSRDLEIRFTVEASGAVELAPPDDPTTPAASLQLEPRYLFDTFVVGTSNQFAHAACASVAEAPGLNYNPLFIYGGTGLGKTHLLHAVGNEILRSRPDATVHYMNSEQFINEVVNNIRRDRMEDFRTKYRRSFDVLLVDDVQFLAGKAQTQVEFFHVFNSLHSAKKQIVLTSDRPPQEITDLEERLKSRFTWGLIADVQPPELETRVAILRAKATSERVHLPDDTAMFLATYVKNNVRELEGALIRLAAHSRLSRVPIDLALARHVLKDLLQDPGPTVTVQQIQKLVATHFNVTVSDLKGARRHRAIALPRMIAMFLARKHTRCSFPDIGKKFGNRDHSTVISAVNKIERLSDSDSFVKVALRDIERLLVS